MTNERWVDREFDFKFDFEFYPKFIERLEATPHILDLLIFSIPEKYYTVKNGNQWSIQENVGHLITVDELFTGRLDDYDTGASELRPSDVSGTRTDRKNYNTHKMNKLLVKFRENRMNYIDKLEKYGHEFFNRSAWHPRLKQQMRVCDMLYFQTEHDDHHLDKIRQMEEDIRQLTSGCL